MRIFIAAVVAIAAMAASVLVASHAQRTTAERHSSENELILNVIADANRAEAVLGAFQATTDEDMLAQHLRAATQLRRDIAAVKKITDGDQAQEQALSEQVEIVERLDSLVERELEKPTLRARVAGLRRVARQRHALTDRLLDAGARLRARQAVIVRSESRRAALVAPALILFLGLIFGAAAAVVQYRANRARARGQRILDEQERFGEALQVTDSQAEAHGLLRAHLEDSLGDVRVTVLNRNNSADRLEAMTPLDEDSPLAGALAKARPRSCMAIRLSRRYTHGDAVAEVLQCEVCGATSTRTSCQPLLVGGEVIGSVLAEHRQPISRETTGRIARAVGQAAPVLAHLRDLAIAETRAATDALTGLPNRRAVDDTLLRMLAQAGRAITPLSVVMLDLDHFKEINDKYGHDRGDEVLAGVSTRLREVLRASDFAGRSGGEEFVLFLPDTDKDGAVQLASKLRESLHQLHIPGVERSITASLGVATYPEDAADAQTLVRSADRALYAAKRAGRDRVEVASSLHPNISPAV